MSEKSNEFQNQEFAVIVEGILRLESLSKPLCGSIVDHFGGFDDLRFYFFKNAGLLLELILGYS